MAHTSLKTCRMKRHIFSKNTKERDKRQAEFEKLAKPEPKTIELGAVASLMMFDASNKEIAGLEEVMGGMKVVVEGPDRTKSSFIAKGIARKPTSEELRE